METETLVKAKVFSHFVALRVQVSSVAVSGERFRLNELLRLTRWSPTYSGDRDSVEANSVTFRCLPQAQLIHYCTLLLLLLLVSFIISKGDFGLFKFNLILLLLHINLHFLHLIEDVENGGGDSDF